MRFAFNAPLTAIAGIFFLDEVLSLLVFFGSILVTTGVAIAVVYGQKLPSSSYWDVVHGSLPVGLLFGFLAAAGQAGGILLSRPWIAKGVDPIAGSAVRVAIAAVALVNVYEFSSRGIQRDHSTWTTEIIMKNLGTGVIGMGVGLTLVMFALQGGEAGIISTLCSAAPVFILPFLWVISARRPVFGVWVGASIVFSRTALIIIKG